MNQSVVLRAISKETEVRMNWVSKDAWKSSWKMKSKDMFMCIKRMFKLPAHEEGLHRGHGRPMKKLCVHSKIVFVPVSPTSWNNVQEQVGLWTLSFVKSKPEPVERWRKAKGKDWIFFP